LPLTTLLALLSLGQEIEGQAVLDKMVAALSKHSSVSGVAWQYFADQKEKIRFKVLRPQYVALVGESYETWQVGRKTYFYMVKPKQYQEFEVPENLADWKPEVGALNGFNAILGQGSENMRAKPGPAKRVEFEGKSAWAVDFTPESFKDGSMILLVDSERYMPLGYETTFGKDKTKMVYEDVVLGAELKPSDFVWKPPAGAKPYERPDYASKVLKPGAKAPDFTLKTPEGKEIRLSEKLKEGNGVLLNFWSYT
jgi:hypothetical protein